jgi:hypothetical protein
MAPLIYAMGLAAYIERIPAGVQRGILYTIAAVSLAAGLRALLTGIFASHYVEITDDAIAVTTLARTRRLARDGRLGVSPIDDSGFSLLSAQGVVHLRDKPAGIELADLHALLVELLAAESSA